MRLNRILFLFIIQALVVGCATPVTRQGYDPANRVAPVDCFAMVYGYVSFDPDRMEMLGSIDVDGMGMSFKCDEDYVLDLMKKEACLVGADIVSITDEKFPDFWNLCYRAKADFIRLKNREDVAKLMGDPHYDDLKVYERSRQASKALHDAISAGIMGGMIGTMSMPRK
ncbi:MAG: hypothetical protein AAGU11_00440 [Syntrophobacteraceae bacterium]